MVIDDLIVECGCTCLPGRDYCSLHFSRMEAVENLIADFVHFLKKDR